MNTNSEYVLWFSPPLSVNKEPFVKAVLLPLELNGLFRLLTYLHCRIRIQTPNLMDLMATLHCAEVFRLHRVATCQRNVKEKQNFLQVREKSWNFEKMSGRFDYLTHVRELSGNFDSTQMWQPCAQSQIQIPIQTANYWNGIGIRVRTQVRLLQCKWANIEWKRKCRKLSHSSIAALIVWMSVSLSATGIEL